MSGYRLRYCLIRKFLRKALSRCLALAAVLLVLALCAQAAQITQPMLPSQAKSGSLPLLPYLDYYLDESGSMDIEEVASPELASSFAAFSLEKLPRRTGVLWLRFTLSPIAAQDRPPVFVLDMGPCVPGAPRLYEPVKNELSGAVEWRELGPGNRGTMLLPEAGQEPVPCYLRLEGLPGIWFSPTVRTPQDAAGNWGSLARSGAVLSLGVVFFLCLLRGVSENGQWRVWTALFVFFALVQALAGMPPQIGNPGLWGLAGILSPGIALMLLPHVGRHLLRARAVSRSMDIQLFLLSLPGAALALLPLVPGWSWLDRWLDLWPLCVLIFLPTAMGAWLMGLPGARRFLLACFLPPLFTAAGVVGLYFGMPANLLASAPLWGVAIAALLLATTRAPDYAQVEGDNGEKAVDLAADLPLPPNPGQDIINLETPLDDPNLRLIPPAAVDLPINNSATEPRDEPTPQKRPSVAPRTFDDLRESALRAPLDEMMREGSALGHCALPPAAREYAGKMLAAARKMAAIISGEDLAQGGAQVRQEESASFNLQRILRDAHDAAAPAAENAGIGLAWYMPPHMPQLYSGAAGALGEVLQSLLESSVRATSSGAVHLSARRVPESADPGHILFTITDSGRGFPPADRSSVALDRAWELVGKHKGCISMDSGAQGTTIAFSLHLAPIASEVEEKAGQAQVMVLGENAEKRREIARMLEPLDIRLTGCASPSELLRRQDADPAGVLVVCGRMATPAASDMLHDFIALARKAGFGACKIMAVNSDNSQDKLLAASGFTHAIPEPLQGEELRSTVIDLVETVLAAYQPPKKPAHRIADEPRSGHSRPDTDHDAHDYQPNPADDAAFAKAPGPGGAANGIVAADGDMAEARFGANGADFGQSNNQDVAEADGRLDELFAADDEVKDVFDDLAPAEGAGSGGGFYAGEEAFETGQENNPAGFAERRDTASPVESHEKAFHPEARDEMPVSAIPAESVAKRPGDLIDQGGMSEIPEAAIPGEPVTKSRDNPILPDEPDETDEIDEIPANVPGTDLGNNLRSDLGPDLVEKLERDLADVLEPEIPEDRRIDLGAYSEIERESGTRLKAMAKMAEDLRAASLGADEGDSRPAGQAEAQAEKAQAGMAVAQAEMAEDGRVEMSENAQGLAHENGPMAAQRHSGQIGEADPSVKPDVAGQAESVGQAGNAEQAGHIELAGRIESDHPGHGTQRNLADQAEQLAGDAQLGHADLAEQKGHETHLDQTDRVVQRDMADRQAASPDKVQNDQEISAEADRIVETIFAPEAESTVGTTKTLITPEAAGTTIDHAPPETPAQSTIEHTRAVTPEATQTIMAPAQGMAATPGLAEAPRAPNPAHEKETLWDDVEWVGEPMPVGTTMQPGDQGTYAPQTHVQPNLHGGIPSDAVEWVGEPTPIIRKKPEASSAARPSANVDRFFKNGAEQARTRAEQASRPGDKAGSQAGTKAGPQAQQASIAGEEAAPQARQGAEFGAKAALLTRQGTAADDKRAPRAEEQQESKEEKKPQESNSLISDFVSKTISQVSSTIERMTRSRKEAKAENAAQQTRQSAERSQTAPDRPDLRQKAAPEIARPANPVPERAQAEPAPHAAQSGTNAPQAGAAPQAKSQAPIPGANTPQKPAPFRFSSTNAGARESGLGTPAQPGDTGAQEVDPAIRVLVGKLDRAIEDAKKSFASRNSQAVADCAAKIADESGQFGLRVLSRMAKCVERAGRAGDMAALNDLLPELVAAVERNRITLTQIR